MNKQFLCFIFFLLMCFTLPLTATAQVVDIPDPRLRAKIEAVLGKASGATITPAEMATLTKLDVRARRISNLTGLEHATNLTKLNLVRNFISNISPLSGLTNLTELFLYGNFISNISPLSGLTNLTLLGLAENSISNISPLSGLTNLTLLHLYENSISDLSPLAGLTNLTELNLGDNFISNISPLSSLTNLTELDLEGNFISNISPLSGLTNLTELDLAENSISNISPLSSLTNLIFLFLDGNSISDLSPLVGLTKLIDLNLDRNSISNISPLSSLTNLHWLFLAENSISDLLPLAGLTKLRGLFLSRNAISNISPLSGLTNLVSLELWGNSISDLSPLVSNTGLDSENEVDVRGNPLNATSINTHIPTLQRRGVRVIFYAVGTETVNIPDRNLRAKIEKALGKGSGATITTAGMATLTWLDTDEASISNLTGLEHATNLTGLSLWGNSISDISSVAGLTKLTALYLLGNNISDLLPLVANTGLGSRDTVNVQSNPLSYLSIHAHIPTLQSRGVTVEFDNRTHPALLKISGDNQKGVAFTSLSQPFVVEAQDENGSALTGISVRFAVTAGVGTLSTTITKTDENGRAQSTLTLGLNLGINTVEVSAAGIQGKVTFHAISDTESPPITADVNSDGSVNILDLIVIASELGNTGTNLVVDVNRDGVVNILDLVLVAGMFDGAAAAPSVHLQVPETLTAVAVQQWLIDARALEVRDLIMKRGIMVLEQLLAALTPTETELLSNYPNPFNPETWMPYRLAEDAFVTLTIYDLSGQIIRTLEVGHRIASAYESRSKAVHWDGRNNLGEQVASGVYFYTLMAGDFSATRKMLILK